MEHGGEVWVASGDYKFEDDGVSRRSSRIVVTSSSPNPPSACRSTVASAGGDLAATPAGGAPTPRPAGERALRLCAGKAQRVIARVEASIEPIVSTARSSDHAMYRQAGVGLPPTRLMATFPLEIQETPSAFSLGHRCPPSAMASAWLKRFGDYSDSLASGWMQVRGNRRRRRLDRGYPFRPCRLT